MESNLSSTHPFDREAYERGLSEFIGTEYYYDIGFGMKCTDGVTYIIEKLQFPGITDFLALLSVTQEFKQNHFRVFRFTNSDKEGQINLVFEDGNYNVVSRNEIHSNKSLPVDEVVIWSEHDVFYIPSER
jgi:hypothetical protein